MGVVIYQTKRYKSKVFFSSVVKHFQLSKIYLITNINNQYSGITEENYRNYKLGILDISIEEYEY